MALQIPQELLKDLTDNPIPISFLVIVIILLLARIRLLTEKNEILERKFDAFKHNPHGEYPPVEMVSSSAQKAIYGGDRNKATELITKQTNCTAKQAEVVIQKIERDYVGAMVK
jgi:hypothetical protein